MESSLPYIVLEGKTSAYKSDGSSTPVEMNYLANLVKNNPWIKRIGEIGFNRGFSSCSFLSPGSATVVSFEYGNEVTSAAKKAIDELFPGKHQLIIGDSAVTVPQYAIDNPDGKFDLFFIDGGHSFIQAYMDLKNVRKLMKPSSLVIIDDITPWTTWGQGPTLAYFDYSSRYHIQFIKRYIELDNELRDFSEMPEGRVCPRSWIIFRYIDDEPFTYKI